MKRREFISLLGGAAVAWPVAARAQQPQRIRTIGVLGTIAEDDPHWTARLMAFERELQRAGWSEGRNVRFERRSAPADSDRTRSHATELVALAPDVILTSSNIGTAILGGQTRTIPIVFVGTGEPVETGLVPNMAPGWQYHRSLCLNLGPAEMAGAAQGDRQPRSSVVAVYTRAARIGGLLHTLDAPRHVWGQYGSILRATFNSSARSVRFPVSQTAVYRAAPLC
jgi:hypothetical protein